MSLSPSSIKLHALKNLFQNQSIQRLGQELCVKLSENNNIFTNDINIVRFNNLYKILSSIENINPKTIAAKAEIDLTFYQNLEDLNLTSITLDVITQETNDKKAQRNAVGYIILLRDVLKTFANGNIGFKHKQCALSFTELLYNTYGTAYSMINQHNNNNKNISNNDDNNSLCNLETPNNNSSVQCEICGEFESILQCSNCPMQVCKQCHTYCDDYCICLICNNEQTQELKNNNNNDNNPLPKHSNADYKFNTRQILLARTIINTKSATKLIKKAYQTQPQQEKKVHNFQQPNIIRSMSESQSASQSICGKRHKNLESESENKKRKINEI